VGDNQRDRLEPAALATALSCETIPALRIFYNRDTVKTPCESKDITIQNNSGLPQGLAGLRLMVPENRAHGSVGG
jgi:hypothetical protein